MPRVTGIHHVAISVKDLERSVAWYRKVLGFSTVLSAEHPNRTEGLETLANPKFSVVFSLHVHSDNEGESFSESHTGLDHVGFAVEDHSSLEEWERHLTELNVEHSPLTDQPLDDQSGDSVVVFRDPDNVQLEFFSMA
jgi:glyoxylase I family protein